MTNDIKPKPRERVDAPDAREGPVNQPAHVVRARWQQQRGLGFDPTPWTAAAEAWQAQQRPSRLDQAKVRAYCEAALADTPMARLEDASLTLHDDGTLEVICPGLEAFDSAMTALGDYSGPGPGQEQRIAWAAEQLTRLLLKHTSRVMHRCMRALRTPAEQPMASGWAMWGQAEVQRLREAVPRHLVGPLEKAMPRAGVEQARTEAADALAKFEALRSSGAVGEALPRLGISDQLGVPDTVVWEPEGVMQLRIAAGALMSATKLIEGPRGHQAFTPAERDVLRKELTRALHKIAFDHDGYVAELAIAATQGLPAGGALVASLKTAAKDLYDQAFQKGFEAKDQAELWQVWRNRMEGAVSPAVGLDTSSLVKH